MPETDTDTATDRPLVPQLRTTVHGQTYGRAYWHEAEFEVTLDARGHDDALTCELNLVDISGHAVYRLQMSRQQASAVHAACGRRHRRGLNWAGSRRLALPLSPSREECLSGAPHRAVKAT